jgi:hypothetical protein
VKDKVSAAVGVVKDIIDAAGNVPQKFEDMKNKAVDIGAALLSPFTAVKDAVQGIIDLVAKIKIPDLPSVDLNPFNGRAGFVPSGLPDPTTSTAAGGTTVNITVQGAIDPYGTAVQIRDLFARVGVAVPGITVTA